jgi:hypothetical protein
VGANPFLPVTLIRAVPSAEPLVAINIEHRHEDEHELFQRAVGRLVFQCLANRQKAGVFAVDFAGMNASLHQQHRQSALLGFGRRQASGA